MRQDNSGLFLRIYKDFWDSGLGAALGIDSSMTLICLATYMNKDRECSPTQAVLADQLGVTPQRIGQRLKQLAEFRFNGEPVIEVRQDGRKKVYRILTPFLRMFD